MRFVKSPYLSVLHRPFENADQCFLSISCYAVCEFGEQRRIVHESELWGQIAPLLGSDAVLDIGMPKRRAEFLVWGAAFAREGAPVTAMHVRAQVGSLSKTLYVVGDRCWKGGVPTAPEPFKVMPIAWSRAFGGPSVPSNPLGKGARPSHGVAPLPNIEEPGRLVRFPSDKPDPAGFGPYDIAWPQRAQFAGTYDGAWFARSYPGFASDMRWDLFNAAPCDQQKDGVWQGDELIVTENMHPHVPTLHGALPRIRPRVFIEQKVPDGTAFREVDLRLDTIWIFPNIQRLVLIHHGLARVQDDEAHDVQNILAACEQQETRESIAFYERALRERLDPESYERHALNPFDLTPRELADGGDNGSGAEQERPPDENGLFGQRYRKQAEQERERVRKRVVELGLDPTAFLPPAVPAPTTPPVSEFGEFTAALEAEADRMKVEAEKTLAEREREIRRICAEVGACPDDFLQAAMQGPPKLSATDTLNQVRAMVAEAQRAGADAGPFAQVLSEQFEKRLHDAEAKMLELYRQSAHFQEPAPRLRGEQARTLRARVEAVLARGEGLAGWDLTGADLGGVAFARANMRGVLLENANLAQADLSGCDLRGAVLAHASLMRSKLDGADLQQSNLGRARLTSASLEHADLREAICYQAVLSGACLRGADLRDADLVEAVVDEVDLSGAQAPRMTFCKTSFTGVKASGADLSESSFLEVTFRDVDFSDATMCRTTFLQCEAQRVKFDRADLTRLVMTADCVFGTVSAIEADLTDANLSGSTLAGADLRAARLDEADLSECNLRGANLSGIVARGSRWGRADLSGANLNAANLMNASLARAVLKDANLRGTNLYGVDLARAEVNERTDLAGAEMGRVRIQPLRTRNSI